MYALNGNHIGQLVISNGKSISPSTISALTPLNKAFNLFYSKKNITSRVPNCSQSEHVYVVYWDYKDYYSYVTVGTVTTKTFAYTKLITTTIDEPISVPCGQLEDSYDTYRYVTSRSEVVIGVADVIEDKINDSLLDPCSKEVLDKLKNATNKDISKMIDRFGQPGSVFNINVITQNVENPNNFAETKLVNGSKSDVNIILNKNYIDGDGFPSRPTDLSVATTIAHEVIHAYIISVISAGGLIFGDFPTIYDAYVADQLKYHPGRLPDAHEELIAEKYVNIIAETIEELHTGKQVADGMATQVYTDLAWNGLYGTKFFNEKYPKDLSNKNYSERERIIKRVHAERSGANFGAIVIAGTPCAK